uniref:Neuroblast differentiation-associated protein AHNAK-like n=1 Tax=Scophthalmus maximus TaxID=52904 RepID=A0A8D2ZZN1_SCOMX
MREQGKTKRRGDARISWPKFPSFGKGRKSHFTRSHSSSEADEQRKLELSPTTSDTESPIKTQDALKGKKRHKMKLSALKKRGRVSSSEDQETDAPTIGQISGDIYQTASDMLSPDECFESLSGKAPEVYVSKNLKVVEEIRLEQNDPKKTVQHKVELISIDSTLKTADLTMALADQESPSGIKSPDEKKKKKDRSEIKVKILGKDKSHKKDTKAKASPKRLKTLGASTEVADQPANEKSDVIPKVEFDFSDVTFMRRSPQKGEEQAKKDKDIKQKQEAKTGPTFKLPKIGLSDISTEETIQKLNVEECPNTIEKLNSAVKEDPYDRLSKSSHSRTQLPKREDIEIPGMEDMSVRTRAKGIKEPKVVLTGQYEEFQTETVQLLIDVDSVKEAVSKLPGFKLPKVDTCGMPIPEEITVIDANAQRISVKTPTKVADTKTKHEAHLTKFDITASSEITKTTVKLPKIATANLTSEGLLIETKVVKEMEKVDKTKLKQSDIEFYKREDITIPGKESPKKDIVFKLPKQNIFEEQGDSIFGERTILLQEVTTPETETRKGKGQIGGVTLDVKIPEIDSIEFIDSVNGSPAKKGGGVSLTGFGVNLNATKPKVDISFPQTESEVKDVGAEEHTIKLAKFGAVRINVPDVDKDINTDGSEVKIIQGEGEECKFKIPNLGISIPKLKGSKTDSGLSKKDATATLPEVQAGVKLSEAPEVDVTLGSIDVSIPEQKVEVEKPSLEIKPLQMEVDIDGQGSKLKMPKFGIKMPRMKGPEFDLSLSKKDVDVTLPEAKAGVKLPDAPKVDVTLGSIDVSIPEQRVEVEKPELEIKPLQTEVEIEGQGSRFKMPKFGIKMPKMKGPEFELSLSKEDVDVTLPEAKAGVKLPGAPEVDATLGSIDVSIPEQKVEVEKPEFKMPKFGIKMPKIKGPEFDLSSSKKDIDVTLPKAKAGVKLPEAPKVDVTLGSIDVSIQEQKVEVEKPELEMKPLQTEVEFEGQGSRFKMPKFGIKMPKIKGPEFDLSSSKKDVDVTLPEAKAGVKLPETAKVDVTLGSIDVSIPEQKVEVEKPELEIKPLQTEFEFDGHGSRFKMPKFGIKMPKIKGPEFDLSSSKRDVDITLPEAKAGVKLPDAPKVDVTLGSIDVSIPEQRVEVEKPELEIKPLQTEVEFEGQGSRFKMPKFGIKMPKMKGPEFELSLSKKDVDVTLPEAKAGVKLPETAKVDVTLGSIDVSIPEQRVEVEKTELEIKPLQTEVEFEGQGSRFKMPKFGIKMPKIKGPEFDLSLSKKDVDVTLPEAKAGVKLPETAKVDVTLGSIDVSIPEQKVEVEKPELEIKPLQTEVEFDGHGSRFKMPKFGIKMPKIKGPEFDLRSSKRDVDITLPEAKAGVKLPDAPKVDVTLGSIDVSIPEQRVEVEKPELEIKPLQTEVEFEGQGSRFKMPKFGIKMPKMKGPEFELSLSKKDVDVTLPEAKAGVKLPEAPNVDATFGSIDVDFPVQKMEVNKPELQIKPLQTEGEHDGQGSKFKMPELGITMPKVRGPEIDLSLSKKDIHATLPKAEAQVKLPVMEHRESGIKVEVKAPEIAVHQQDVEGSPLKFKMPTFKLPKFGVGTPNISVEGPDMDKDVKIDGGKGHTFDLKAKAEVKLPEAPKIAVEMKSPVCEVEIDRKGEEFNMPKFGMSMPKVKGPEFHLGFSKKDVNVTLPEAKADVNLPDVELQEPSAKVEIKAPAIKVAAKDTGGSPSKFKMPSFSFSKPKVKGPVIDLSLSKKDTDITLQDTNTEVKLPEVAKIDVSLGKAEVLIPEAKVEVKKPEVQIKPQQTDVELEGQGGKFKMPKFGITMPKVKGPDFDLSFSKKDVDVTLPKAKAEVEKPELEIKPLETEDISLPEAKTEINLPDVELKEPSAKVEVKAPEIEAQLGSMKGSPSKFKMPTFKFPKFGVAAPNVSAEIPDTNKEIKIDGAHMNISAPHTDIDVPEVKGEVYLQEAEVKEPLSDVEVDAKIKKSRFSMPKFSFSKPSVKAPEVDLSVQDVNVALPEGKVEVKIGEVDMKSPEHEAEVDGQGSKFKMPKFGISMPKVTGPDIDLSLSKKDVDVTIPEAKAQVKLPDVDLKGPSAEVEIQHPEMKVVTKDKDGSPSKYKMPTFKLPKFGVGTPSSTIEVRDMEKDVKINDVDINIPEEVLAVHIVAPSIDTEGKSIDLKTTTTEDEEKGSKFKLPKFGISMPKVTGPDIDLSLSKKDVDVTIPEAKAEVKLPDVDLKGPSAEVEIKHPEMKVVTKDKEGSPSKYKMPTFKFPKFGVGTPSSTIEVPDIDKDVKINDVDINIPEEVLAVNIVAPSIDTEGKSIDLKTTTTGDEEKGSKFKLPKFGISMPKVTGPDIDLSLSKKDVDVTIPEAKAEVKLPDVDLKGPSAEVEIKHPEMKVVTKDKEGSPSKYKMPTFKFPKFGVGTPSSTIEVPDIDKEVKIHDVDINIPEEVLAVNIVAPTIDTEGKSIDLKTTTTGDEEKGSKFKLPKFGISMPKVTGPDIDLSLSKKDVDVTIPGVKAEVKLPDVDLKEPSAEVEIKPPEIKVVTKDKEGSPSKFKMPTFKFPKFGVGTPSSTIEQSTKELEFDVSVPEVDVSLPKGNVEVIPSEVELKAPEGDVEVDGLESKFKMPKFGITMPKVKGPDVDLSFSKKDVNVTQTKAEVEVDIPEGPKIDVDVKPLESEAEIDGQGGKFKMPKFGISMPKVKGPEIDLSLSKKDLDVTLPEAKAEVQLTDVEIKQPSGKVDAKAPEIKGQTSIVEGSPSKLKMPTFTLPKFGAATPKVSVQVPDVDKDIQIDGAKMEVTKEGAIVNVTAPSIDAEGLSVDVKPKESELEGSESRFKMPKFGISMPKVKGPEIDLSLSKKDGDVTLPEAKTEVKLPSFEVKEPKGDILVPDAPTVETEAKLKRPNWTFPKFSFSRTSGKAHDGDMNLETPKADVTSPEVKAEMSLPDVEVKGPSGIISMEEQPAEELDGNLKKSKFSLPKFSFSKSSVNIPEVSAELPQVDVFLPEGELRVRQPVMEIKAPELEAEHDVQGSKFKLPKFGISLPKSEGPEVDLNASQKGVDVTIPHRAEVKLPEADVKESPASVETEAKLKDVGGSPSKFKMPTLKMPKFGGASYDVTVEATGPDKAENYGAKLEEDVTVKIKGPSIDIKTDMPKAVMSDSEKPKTETDSVGQGSPSRFKLPLFKMPNLGFSKSKPEDECVPADNEGKDNQLVTEEESKSPKLTLTSFGEILNNFDVEFDVSKTDDGEQNLKAIKEVDETSEPGGKQLEEKETQSNTKQDTTKSPEKTSWFKFPKFGLSSPSEPAKISEKDEHKDEKTPVDETGTEEMSPTSSIQSSDAFADVSSTMTSEYFCPSASSPTKVTAKYSDPSAATEIEETHTNIITSTTRTALISVEPNMPEKITILSSGVSSSSEDTLKLESGKIHVITTNIQATPEAQHAKLLTAVQVQSSEGLPLQSEDREAASWTVEDSQSGKRRVFERHFVRETSSERSESKETIVITKQITHIFDSSEPISGDTASSIQRLKDSMHSEKMRFFDGAEK